MNDDNKKLHLISIRRRARKAIKAQNLTYQDIKNMWEDIKRGK
jgi:hypothetical protein